MRLHGHHVGVLPCLQAVRIPPIPVRDLVVLGRCKVGGFTSEAKLMLRQLLLLQLLRLPP